LSLLVKNTQADAAVIGATTARIGAILIQSLPSTLQFIRLRVWYDAHKMSTNAHGFLGFFGCNLYFWGLIEDLGKKCTQKCAQNAYEKLAKVSKCHDLLANVLICIHLYSLI